MKHIGFEHQRESKQNFLQTFAILYFKPTSYMIAMVQNTCSFWLMYMYKQFEATARPFEPKLIWMCLWKLKVNIGIAYNLTNHTQQRKLHLVIFTLSNMWIL